MPRPKTKKRSVRLSVALDGGECEEQTRLGAELGLSAARLIRRAVSEFAARHRDGIEADLPLRQPGPEPGGGKKSGGSYGA